MKVYFSYSPRGDHHFAQLIYDAIKELGHKHVSTFVKDIDPESFYQAVEKEWKNRYLNSVRSIEKADICIFELTIPSTASGQLAQLSLNKFKPTILLYRKGAHPHFSAGLEETEKRVQILEYSEEDLKDVLKYAFDMAEEYLNTRFTLLLPRDIVNYLNQLKKDGQSRSEYIRDLIKKDMSST